METGAIVLDLVTQTEVVVVGKFTDGQYLLMELCKHSQEVIEELFDDKKAIIENVEILLRYSHQIEEI